MLFRSSLLAFLSIHAKVQSNAISQGFSKGGVPSPGYKTTLFLLATERFASAQKHGFPPLLTYHRVVDDPDVRKHSDGTLTLISIPVLEDDMIPFYEVYTFAYNSWHLRAADIMVQDGKLTEAKRLYLALKHLDMNPSVTAAIVNRLDIIAKMEVGTDLDVLRSKIASMMLEGSVLSREKEAIEAAPEQVKSLQDVELLKPSK